MAATMQGLRQIASEMQNGTETMTAVEMAMTSHRLNRSGEIAKTSDGRTWYWSNGSERWVAAR